MMAGFPHSDISGSKSVCRLPEAFRRLPRLSSPLTAKASTRFPLEDRAGKEDPVEFDSSLAR